MNWMWRALAVLVLLPCGAMGPALGQALGQTWPDLPVRIVVPLTAGSATDVMARIVAQLGAEPMLMSPEQFDREITTSAALVKAAGIPVTTQ